MSDQSIVVSEILPSLLTDHSPELGARLKQRIQAVFAARGLPAFDPQKEGCRKFAVYLERFHGDIVQVVRVPDESDVRIYKQMHSHSLNTQHTPHPVNQNTIVRNNVWQAFLNPDSSRKRFFNKKTKEIIHFIPSVDVTEEAEVSGNPEAFIEIIPISGTEQLGWMRAFLADAPLGDTEKEVISSQIQDKYSSALNATFTKSLGIHGSLWRNHRLPRVMQYMRSWAQTNEIPFSDLCISGVSHSLQEKEPVSSFPGGEQFTPTEALPPRQLAHKLLDLMAENDIAQMVLPTMMNTLLFKSRQ